MVAYTSGTTGKPKGAVHVHGGFLVKIAQEVAHQVDMSGDDRLCWVTDLGWIMGPWELVGGWRREGRSSSRRGSRLSSPGPTLVAGRPAWRDDSGSFADLDPGFDATRNRTGTCA